MTDPTNELLDEIRALHQEVADLRNKPDEHQIGRDHAALLNDLLNAKGNARDVPINELWPTKDAA
jgi:hypothetical protein